MHKGVIIFSGDCSIFSFNLDHHGSKLEVAIGRVGFGFGRVGSGFGSNIFGFRSIRVEPGQVSGYY
jgi:hypothetical protein